MRIKTLRAETLPVALQRVREQYGENAIVLDTEQAEDGAIVRVGVEQETSTPLAWSADEPASKAAPADPPKQKAQPAPVRQADMDRDDRIAEALVWHGVPILLTREILQAARQSGEEEAEAALIQALTVTFRFGRPERLPTPVALVGPPGSGKTATLAKIAAARTSGGDRVALVNADVATAGADARVRAFAEALDVTPRPARDAVGIAAAVEAAEPGAAVLVDTASRAPADIQDVEALAREIAAAGHGVLVLSAAISPDEATELAHCFADAGARSLIMTQLDVARRLGALLAAAKAGDLVIAGVSLGRKVGDGLKPLTPKSIARLLLAPPTALPKLPPRKPQSTAAIAAYAQAAAKGAAA